MILERSDELIKGIRKDAKEQILEHLYVTLFGLFAAYVGYHNNSHSVIMSGGIIGIILIIYLGYTYNSFIRKNILINHVIIEISSDDKNITCKTADTFILHVIHKKSIVFTMPINNLHFELTDDNFGKLFSKNSPFSKNWIYNGKSYNFTYYGQKFLLLTGFFSDKVEKIIDSSLSSNVAS